MKINENSNGVSWAYKVGFYAILALPLLVAPPYFFPADWGKTIVFRSIMAVLLFLFAYQLLYRENEMKLPKAKNNIVFWLLGGFLLLYLLATIFSVDPTSSLWGNPYRGGGFVTFVFYFFYAFLAVTIFKKEEWNKVWLFSIFIGLLVSFVAIIQYNPALNRIFNALMNAVFNLSIPLVPDRPASTMGNPIPLAIYLLLLSFLTLSLAIKEPFETGWSKTKKIFYIFSLTTFVLTILISGSRAVWLGLAIGAIYFFLFYPKKIKALKLSAIGLLILIASVILCANTINIDKYPKFLQQNRLFSSINSRLSMRLFLTDPRFFAWSGIDYKILIEKPILGYGPENFSVGFDKHYDPSIPYMNQSWGDWWDRAHNVIIQTTSDAGFFSVIIYLALFVVLFQQLQKIKNDNKLTAHAIQATLIGYLVANFFSFDTFSTYIIFFLIISYTLHLIGQNDIQDSAPIYTTQNKVWWKSVTTSVLFIFLLIFLWQYNILPLQINAGINKANALVGKNQCGRAFDLLNKIIQEHSFLDSYTRMEYVEINKTCSNNFSDSNLDYIKKNIELLSEATKIQPLYTRNWIFMGNFETILAGQEKDLTLKNALFKQAKLHFDKALQLSPKHQEIPISQAEMEIVAGNYNAAKNYAEKCISLNPDFGDCYFYLALSEIYLGDADNARKNMLTATGKRYNIDAEISLNELSTAYASVLDYKNLAVVYDKLIAINPNIAQYHSALAFCYAKLGQYSEARQEALKVLEISPASKENVDAFLRTLP